MEAGAAINLSSTAYRKLLNSLPDALLIMELICQQPEKQVGYTILDLNTKFEEFSGRKREDLLGRKTTDVFPPRSAEWLHDHEDIIKAGRPARFAFFYQRLQRWYDLNIVPLENDSKCALIFTDITEERKSAQIKCITKARKAYSWALGEILRSLGSAEEIRDAAAHLLRDHLKVGRVDFIKNEGDVADFHTENPVLVIPIVLYDKLVAFARVTPITPRVWTSDEVHLVRATAQRTWLAVERAEALAELKKSKQAAQALVERLETADKNKSEMLAVLSHELRNPLAVIGAAVDLFELSCSNGESQNTIRTMRAQVEQLTMIVDDLRDLSQISGHEQPLARRMIDLRTVVQDAAQRLNSAFADKSVKLEKNLPTNAVMVKVDPDRIAKGIGSVLLYALACTPKDGTVKLDLRCVDESAQVKIKDGGAGISPGLFALLFEPFVHGGHSRLRGITGSVGVGLADVKDVFAKHDGWVRADNDEADGGALFTLSLPLYTPPNLLREADFTPKCRRCILCIEDDTDLAKMLRGFLSTLGHETHLAYSGCEGLDKARQLEPDIIFCDLGLEDISGFDVAIRIRNDEKLKDIFLVALTGCASARDSQRAIQNGFDLHIAKPFKISTIEDILTDFSVQND